MTDRGLCTVVLAAGAGTRLRPLTELRPKALCPVGNVPLLDRALARLTSLGLSGPGAVAVNAHHHAEQIAAAVAGRAHLSVEQPEALGTAGAVAALRDWVAGRDVLVVNADAYLAGALPADFVAGWSGERPRLLVVEAGDRRRDFDRWRFAGVSLLPAEAAARLRPEPTGLYEVLWRAAWAAGALELTPFDGTFIDCGNPADYLAANLHARRHAADTPASAASDASAGAGTADSSDTDADARSAASDGAGPGAGDRRYVAGVEPGIDPAAVVTGEAVESVVGAGAVVAGRIVRCVVWPGARVDAHESLTDAIRADALTVHA
ncbi:sugar phosphate nucleotidyltransferase [Cryptosporangium aurantiacum]|uniref:Mannose-1-phosphate guanylyltransferase n=1 Tax=Cryptosporangium aurantiacum TaxID=134849 RepID=A0A1M7R7I0_9ACTN|nr:sugar phosphate nucleotidyltransferase [Cryptosporangium aurantiacum]SHN42267.1 mannose-1-phosphate guanylyltransferase [Cryptosporangium aurantiacum]